MTKDISPETILNELFKERKTQVKKTYIKWGDKVFVRKTSKGNHWLYRGAGAARFGLMEAIYNMEDCPLRITKQEDPWKCIDYTASMENIGWWVDELEKRGIIEYKTLESFG